jgi:hypothetical protein
LNRYSSTTKTCTRSIDVGIEDEHSVRVNGDHSTRYAIPWLRIHRANDLSIAIALHTNELHGSAHAVLVHPWLHKNNGVVVDAFYVEILSCTGAFKSQHQAKR